MLTVVHRASMMHFNFPCQNRRKGWTRTKERKGLASMWWFCARFMFWSCRIIPITKAAAWIWICMDLNPSSDTSLTFLHNEATATSSHFVPERFNVQRSFRRESSTKKSSLSLTQSDKSREVSWGQPSRIPESCESLTSDCARLRWRRFGHCVARNKEAPSHVHGKLVSVRDVRKTLDEKNDHLLDDSWSWKSWSWRFNRDDQQLGLGGGCYQDLVTEEKN